MSNKNSMNRVELMGRLGRDPEVRQVGASAVTTFSVATDESYRNHEGEMVKQTEWHNVVFWGAKGEEMAEVCKKGGLVHVQGKLRTRSWEPKEGGAKQYRTEIVAFEVEPMETATPEPPPVDELPLGEDIFF